jgi:hypothetical protein
MPALKLSLLAKRRRISSFRNSLPFKNYLKILKIIVHKKYGHGNFNHRFNISLIHFGRGKFYEGVPGVRRSPIR